MIGSIAGISVQGTEHLLQVYCVLSPGRADCAFWQLFFLSPVGITFFKIYSFILPDSGQGDLCPCRKDKGGLL